MPTSFDASVERHLQFTREREGRQGDPGPGEQSVCSGIDEVNGFEGNISDERVMNYFPNGVPASLIYPSAIIVGDVEINRTTPKIEEVPVLKHPLQR